MKLLICAGDILQAGEIMNTVDRLLVKRFLGMVYTGVFAAETKTGTKEEIKVYILPDDDSLEPPKILRLVADALAERLSLNSSQVICAATFH